MRKWEEKYQKLKNGDFDARIDELKGKIDDKKATREEFKEYENLSKSKDNVRKVDNIMEYRDKLQESLKETKEELETRKNIKEAAKDSERIEEELNKIMKKLEVAEANLKRKDLSVEDREKANKERNELLDQRDKNHKEYLDNQALLTKGLNKNEKFKDLSDEDLKKMNFETSSKISKCNMVANNLINGLSWDSIDLKLDNWKDKKFTSTDEKLSDKGKREEKDDSEKIDNKEEKSGSEEMEDVFSSDKKAKNHEKEMKRKAFAEKHPRLAKVANWFRNKFKRNDLLEAGKVEDKNPETLEDVKTDREEISFKEYIKEIAEKGLDAVKADELAARKERLAQLRKEKGWRQGDTGAKGLSEEGKKALNDIDDIAR